MHWLTRPGGTPTGMPPPAPFFFVADQSQTRAWCRRWCTCCGARRGTWLWAAWCRGLDALRVDAGPGGVRAAPYWPRSACSASASSSTSCRTRASSGSWAGAPSSCARSSSRGSSASGNPRTHWGSRASCGPYSRSRTRSISIPSLLDLLLCRRRCARV
jgi:hypothetical protein